MSEHQFKLKHGEKRYDNFYHAATVAEAKAAEDDKPVIISRKLLNRFEDVAQVHPDGRVEELVDDLDTGL